MSDWVDIPESVDIGENDLTVSKAKQALLAVNDLNHVRYIKCARRNDGWEFIVFETDLQLPQKGIVNDIRIKERIAIGFDPLDETVPEVFALRSNFPPYLPHTNLRYFETPKSLCLYDLPYSEVKVTYTSKVFIERIRNWLRSTALGTLHQDSQFLEPFLNESDGTIILPLNVSEKPFTDIKIAGEHNEKPIFIAYSGSKADSQYILIRMLAGQHVHGTFNYKPSNLALLSFILKSVDVKFEDRIVEYLDLLHKANVLSKKIILDILIPKTKTKADRDEEFDHYCFTTDFSAEQIGIQVGMWDKVDGILGQPIGFNSGKITDDSLSRINIKTLMPQFSFSKPIARLANKVPHKKETPNILAIGMGSLGSQIFNNLVRQGYGQWTVVDDDVLFPHNLARHILASKHIGKPKSASVVALANDLFTDSPISKAENFNALESKEAYKLTALIKQADAVLDFSASVALARHLAQIAHKQKRIISCFLNPNGTDLIIIAEDKKQNHRIDYLEMVYYRALITHSDLKDHLGRLGEKKYYAQSCRDITISIPQEYFSIHSGIAVGALKKVLDTKEEHICIWSLNTGSHEIKKYTPQISKIHYQKNSGWEIFYDDIFLEKMAAFREQKLPNETGGIIIGSYDMQRMKIYLVDHIGSPEDSEEYPISYKRGIKGLDQKLEAISIQTADNLRYVGEWHSHPKECSTRPSDDDKTNFEWIRKILKNEDLPPLSLIIGDDKKHTIYLETMK